MTGRVRGTPRARLELADQRIVRRVRRKAGSIWVSDDHLVELALTLKELLPECGVGVYTRRRDGSIGETVQDFEGPMRRAGFSRKALEWIEDNRQYVLQGADRFANRAAPTDLLLEGRLHVYEGLRDNVLRPHGALYQLRITLYDESQRFVGYCGFARTKRRGEFGLRERLMLDSLAPILRDGFSMMQLLGEQPSGSSELTRVLEMFEEPAWLVGESGAVLFGNRAACGLPSGAPVWLQQVPRVERGITPLLGKVVQLELDGRPVWLVVPRRPPSPHEARTRAAALASLPLALVPVAELLLSGLSDKEIAAHTEVAPSTVRTYVTRIYRRLEVSGRGELLRKLG